MAGRLTDIVTDYGGTKFTLRFREIDPEFIDTYVMLQKHQLHVNLKGLTGRDDVGVVSDYEILNDRGFTSATIIITKV